MYEHTQGMKLPRFTASFYLGAVCAFGYQAGAQITFPEPGPWWDYTRNDIVSISLDLNRDGIDDLVLQGSLSTTPRPDIWGQNLSATWKVQTRGGTRVLAHSTGHSPEVTRLEDGVPIPNHAVAPDEWTTGLLSLGSSTFTKVSADRVSLLQATGPFSQASGFLAVLIETGVDPNPAWVRIPAQLAGLNSFPIPLTVQNSPPEYSFESDPATPLLAGTVVVPPAQPIYQAIDVSGDGRLDAVVERRWRTDAGGSNQLVSVTVTGREGSRLLALSPSGDLQLLASPPFRWLIQTNPPPPWEWAAAERRLVALEVDPASGLRTGPLAFNTNLWLAVKTGSAQAGWGRLDAEGKVTGSGGVGGILAAVGERIGRDPLVVTRQRFDFNGDGLLDATVLSHLSADVNFLRLDTYEPGLVASTAARGTYLSGYRIDIPSSSPRGSQFVAEPTEASHPSLADSATVLHHSEWVMGMFGRFLVTQFSLEQKYVPLRIRFADGWHAGWLGVESTGTRHWFEPRAGVPAYAGLYHPPDEPPVLALEARGTRLRLSWDPTWVGYRLEEREFTTNSRWVAASRVMASGEGFIELGRGEGKLYRLSPDF